MWPFGKRHGSGTNVAVIDISLASVGAAFVHVPENGKPTLVHTVRVPLEERGGEEWRDTAMLGALREAGEQLVREGAGSLRRQAGSASLDHVLVSVGCPWQDIGVRMERIRPGASFVFTKHMVDEALEKNSAAEGGFRAPKQVVIATLLNGYPVAEPFGKQANRAELIVLSTRIKDDIQEQIEGAMRSLFHVRTISTTALAPASYDVLQFLFPHEHDYLVLAVSGNCTDVANIKHGHLVDAGALACGTNALMRAAAKAGRAVRSAENPPGYIDQAHNARFTEEVGKAEDKWREELATMLRMFASRNALPRTIFLISDETARGFLSTTLNAESLRTLWLSDEPLSIVPVMPKAFSAALRHAETAEADVPLAFLALYAARMS